MNDSIASVRAILSGLWAYRWPGFLAASLLGLTAAAVVAMIPARYEASARVFVDTQSILKPLLTGITVEPNVEQQLSMMARTLISRPNVERAARESGIEPSPLAAAQHDALVDRLMKNIQFRTGGRDNLYTLTYRGETSESTLKFVGALLSIFMETNEIGKRRDNEQAKKFLDDQIKTYLTRLQEAESAIKNFKLRNLNVMPNLAQDYVARTGEAQRERSAARLQLRQAERARDALAKRLLEEPPSFTSTEAIGLGIPQAPNEIDLRIDSNRKRLDELLTRFTEEHPDVIGTRRVLEQLTEERAAELRNPKPQTGRTQTVSVPNKVYQDIKLNLTQTEATIASLSARVAEAELRMREATDATQSIPKVEADYAQLNRDYEINKKNYEQLLARRESAQISEDLDTKSGVVQFKTVDPPRVTLVSWSANRPLIFLASLLGSILIGLAFAFLRSYLKPTFHSSRPLYEAFGLPVLGTVSRSRMANDLGDARMRALGFGLAALAYLGIFGLIAGFSILNPLAS